MANIISHEGVVTKTDGSHIQVRIIQTSACASCNAKGHCSAAESKEKFIEIHSADMHYKPGDRVEVYGETSVGMKAVLYAFVIPFLILIITLFGVSYLSAGNELISIGVSFLFLIIYYVILANNKHRLVQTFSFKIKTINNSTL